MKLSKKILAAFSVATLLTTAAVFTSCADDADSEGAISGRNNNYTVSYTNNTNNTYRAYNGTNLKHSGGTFLITVNNQKATQTTSDGTMGIIWDKHTNDNKLEDFFIAGAAYGLSGAQKLGVYVSKFTNIDKDKLQEQNFGASSSATGTDAKEESLNATSGSKDSNGFYYIDNISPDSDGNVYVVFDIQPNDTDNDGTDGGYTVKIYTDKNVLTESGAAGKFAVKSDAGAAAKTFNIAGSVTGYTNSFKAQNYLAVYANIRNGHTLDGTWTLGQLINSDEVVEE